MNHPTNSNTRAQARRADLVLQELADEVLVYDLKTHEAHCLNKTAAFVWQHCDGETSVSELAALMEKEWGQPVIEDVIRLALKQLSRAGLLQRQLDATDNASRVSRRTVLRRLGTAAAMIPVVMSIVAPTASAGASVPPACLSCIKKITGASDCGICVDVQGACFDNAGCGNGQFLKCDACGPCLGTTGGADTVSWVAASHGC